MRAISFLSTSLRLLLAALSTGPQRGLRRPPYRSVLLWRLLRRRGSLARSGPLREPGELCGPALVFRDRLRRATPTPTRVDHLFGGRETLL